jgi:hypothetical protein
MEMWKGLHSQQGDYYIMIRVSRAGADIYTIDVIEI